jgi:hypothetical protein
MFGTAISIHFLGKKRWMPSIIFWVVYLVTMAIVSAILTAVAPQWVMVSIVVSAAIFILLAHKWYKFSWINSVKLFAVAFVIDIVLMYIIMSIVVYLGITLPTWIPFYW